MFKKLSSKTKPTASTASDYPHGDSKGYDQVGKYNGTGINFGKIVWEGPLGGLFFYNNKGNRSSFRDRNLVDFF